LEHLSLWKNERISDDAFDFTEREEEERHKRRLENESVREAHSVQQNRKPRIQKHDKRRETEGMDESTDFLDGEAVDDIGTSGDCDATNSPDDERKKRAARKSRHELRKERSRAMLVRSSSTLLYQLMREGALSLQLQQEKGEQQKEQHSNGLSATPLETKNLPSLELQRVSKLEGEKEKKKQKPGIAASASSVETRTHQKQPLPVSSNSAETLEQMMKDPVQSNILAPALTPVSEHAIIMPDAVLPVEVPPLYNLKSLCLKNCPKVLGRKERLAKEG